MSEQRRFRQEARQGFMQFAFHLYNSYKEDRTEEKAKEFVASDILDIFKEFGGEDGLLRVTRQTLEQGIKLHKEQYQTSDDDQKMFNLEAISKLEEVLFLLRKPL